MNSFVVIGIGRFGESVARTLSELGNEVLAIDAKETVIQEISEHVTHAVAGDVTNKNFLKSCGINNFDAAVVAIGENMEASILVTVLIKEMGGKYILAKAQSKIHAKVLSQVGADTVVFPESDMGVRVAHNLISANLIDFIELSPECRIIEITVPEKWKGKTLKEINVRAKFGINIIAIKNNSDINISPGPDTKIKNDDVLVVIGSNSDLNKLNKNPKSLFNLKSRKKKP